MKCPWSVVEFQELVTNPYQVVGVLPVDRDIRTNAGVNEQEISAAELIAQALHEQFVSARKDAEKAAMQIAGGLGSVAQLDAIGRERLHAAQLLPVVEDGRILKETFHHGFVVATQANRAIRNQPDRQQIDHCPGTRPAIDIVAEIDLDRMCDRSASDVIVDTSDYLTQQVGPTVDIANGIDACVGWR